MDLHATWGDDLTRATALTAHSADGLRAKAAVLLAAMSVVVGPDHRNAAPHELLAASLARDLNALIVPDVRSPVAPPTTDDDAVRNV